jgi:hypothetical protein
MSYTRNSSHKKIVFLRFFVPYLICIFGEKKGWKNIRKLIHYKFVFFFLTLSITIKRKIDEFHVEMPNIWWENFFDWLKMVRGNPCSA